MKKDESGERRDKDLRQQAEELLRKKSAEEMKFMHEADIRAIVHELQVHQIELKMQNEELQRAYNTAEEIRDRYIDLFDFAPVGYFTLNEGDGSIRVVNLSGAAMLGVERNNLIGKRFAQFIAPEFRGVFNDFCKKALRSDQKQTCEVHLMKDDLPSFYAQIEGIAIEKEGASGKEIRVSLIDITDRKRADEEREKIHKLESLGIIAGGIAHDFNNLLAGILGNINLAKMRLNPEDQIFRWLDGSENACLRAKDLTYQLLTFSKGGEPVKKVFPIAKLLRDAVNFALSGSNIKGEFSVPDDIWAVNADEMQIHQVINNLALNAIHAMPEGGIIRAGCENAVIRTGNALPLKQGSYVKVAISDSGSGIPEEHLKKIFDPYFTTKEGGKGLGLTICYSILKRHNGYMTVESKSGEGTTFFLYLPASHEKIDAEKEERKPFAGIGRILVMDDDEIILAVASDMLRSIGYEVDVARGGHKALEMYKKARGSGKPFEAVIMDLTVPGGMGGREAIVRLREIDPAVRAIVSSGYSNDPIIADYRKYGFSGAVTKPYRVADLSEALQRVMTGRDK